MATSPVEENTDVGKLRAFQEKNVQCCDLTMNVRNIGWNGGHLT